MISALITVPAITSMLSVPDNVPLEGIEYAGDDPKPIVLDLVQPLAA